MTHKAIVDAIRLSKERGLSQQDIADLSGRDRAAVAHQLFDVNSNPTLSTLEAYEDALDAEVRFVPRESLAIQKYAHISELHSEIEQLKIENAILKKEIELKEQYTARMRARVDSDAVELAEYKEHIKKLTNYILRDK